MRNALSIVTGELGRGTGTGKDTEINLENNNNAGSPGEMHPPPRVSAGEKTVGPITTKSRYSRRGFCHSPAHETRRRTLN